MMKRPVIQETFKSYGGGDMRKITLIVFFIFALYVSGSFLYTNSGFGEVFPVVDAALYSMGGVSVFSGENPYVFTGTAITLNGGISIPSESRSKRVFDSYDNTVGKVVVASGTYFLPGNYGLNARFGNDKILLGFDFHPYIYSNYRYFNQIRNEFYVVTGEEETKAEFNVSGYNPYVGFRFGYFSAGLGFRVLNGYSYTYDRIDSTATEVWKRWKGYNFNGGFLFTPSPRFSLGVLFNSGFYLNSSSDTLFYPPVFSTGVRYAPPNLLPSVVMAEIGFIPWTQATMNGGSAGFNDLLIYRFGIQHKLTSGLFLRLGFNYSGSPVKESIARGTFTAGLGWKKGKNKLDVSLNFSNINYKGEEVNLTGDLGTLYFSETETDILVQIRREL